MPSGIGRGCIESDVRWRRMSLQLEEPGMNQPVTWVLLRGLTRETGHWGDFPALLLQSVRAEQADARLQVLDLPGNGELFRQTSPSRVADMVSACRAILAQRGIGGPVYLLAMSLGAMVACEWAERHPGEVDGVVLINASLRPHSSLLGRLRPLDYWRLLALAMLPPRVREAGVLRFTSRMVEQPDHVLAAWLGLQRAHPVAVRNSLRQLLAAMRYRTGGVKPAAHMLLLCSQGDSLVDWHCSRALSRAWGVPMRLHTRAGHDLPLDDPQWVSRAVVDWLAALRRVGSTMPGELDPLGMPARDPGRPVDVPAWALPEPRGSD